MDFFQHQEAARRRTGLLVALFLMAVALIIASVYAVIAGALTLYQDEDDTATASATAGGLPGWPWDWQLFAAVAGGTSVVIGGGSLYRIASLSGGGHNVAELLGGRPIDPNTSDLDERKVLNVVEEMAIASGTPVPPVYLLAKERGINAFAAGHTPGDAVIGVTRGCIEQLSRDELQGVVAHEFSHILNGDMRMNIRLMGVLFGILLISTIGWILFRSSSGGTYRSGARSNDKKGGNPLPLVGLALYVIGYVGVFFGNLIKAAVSRQREFLADASAVQFTRNPDGIAGALKKIGALDRGSRVDAPEAEEASHMFFGDAFSGQLHLFATHPPLAERIRRIDPSFDGDFSHVRLAPPGRPAVAATAPKAASRRDRMPLDPVRAVAQVGTLDPTRLALAAALLESLPRPLAEAAREPFGAQAVVLALLLDADDESVRVHQLGRLAETAPPAVDLETRKLMPEVLALDPRARLPLVELALPALRRMSRSQYASFAADVRALIEADDRVSLFEFALQRLLLRHLSAHHRRRAPAVPHQRPDALVGPAADLLSALAHLGHGDPDAAARAYRAGLTALGWPAASSAPLRPDDAAGRLASVDRALDTLATAAPALKKSVLEASAACIAADGHVTLEEGELLRAIADSLDCPMPPLDLAPA